MFNKKKRIEFLEEQNTTLKNKISDLENANKEAETQAEIQYDELNKKNLELRNLYTERDNKVSQLTEELGNKTKEIENLETRLTTLPNREQTKLKAIHELAQGYSDEGYDGFLKDMIEIIVDKGITAYEATLKRNLKENEWVGNFQHRDQFPRIDDKSEGIGIYVGTNLLSELDKPKVDFMIGLFPFLNSLFEDKPMKNSYKKTAEKYGEKPSIRLTFRTIKDFQYQIQREKLGKTLLPKEWEEQLEADKDVLLKAFAFGFITSYYEDVNVNPKLPVVVSDSRGRNYDVPKEILKMQERAGLVGDQYQILLQDLGDTSKASSEKFSAGVLRYFKEKENNIQNKD